MTNDTPRRGPYPEPAIYDILNTPGTRAEVEAFMRIQRRQNGGVIPVASRVFEPGCGTGRYLRLAGRRGFHLAGFDRDAGMLAYARGRRGLEQANLFQADMADFLGAARKAGIGEASVDVAWNPVNTIRHLQSDRPLIAHLNQMARLLKPGGYYIVGISLVDYTWLEADEDHWAGTRGRCRVRQLVNYLPPEPGTPLDRTETVISHLTITVPRQTTHLDHRYRLRTYDQGQWQAVLEKSHLRRIAGYDGQGRPLGDRRLPYQLEVLAGDPHRYRL